MEFTETAESQTQAYEKASDSAMEYLESRLKSSRIFDEFWEYEVKTKLIEATELKPKGLD